MSIPSYIIEQINSQADIVSIIGKHTTLKKAGNEFKGCCPFHGEKSPSFYVNPQKNFYHCFGCGAKGNPVGFLKDYENLTFVEAIKELSQQTGIEIPEEDNSKVSYKRRPTISKPSHQPAKNVKHRSTTQQSFDKPSTVVINTNKNSNVHIRQHQSSLSSINNSPLAGQQIHNTATSNSVENSRSGLGIHDYSHAQQALDDYQANFDQASFSDADYAGYIHSENINFDSRLGTQGGQKILRNAANFDNTPQIEQADGNLYDLLEQVHQFYQKNLVHFPHTKSYFLDRGLSKETIETFGLGYAPSGWQHLETAFPNDIEGLKILGLIRTSEKGKDYNLLRDRVIFVIRDNQGRVVGFAGRALDNSVKPKYINSSDSPVFHKQHILYGYYESRQHRANDWLVVEGYMDVIALYQAGIYGAVASMGTATNEAQISRLLSLNPTLTLSFDGDAAGQKAAWRTLEVSLPVLTDEKELRFLTLPAEHDPDTFIAEYGTDAMRQQIRQAVPLSEYVFNYLSNRHDLSRPEGKAKLMAEVRTLSNLLPKGSSFKYLLNNHIYQKVGGRKKHDNTTQNLLLDFSTKFTLSINLCLCLLYQPQLIADNPLEKIYQHSAIDKLVLPKHLQQKLQQSSTDVIPLPSWQDLADEHLFNLQITIKSLENHLPNDFSLISHFVLPNLPANTRNYLAPHWKSFYEDLVERAIVDVEDMFIDLLSALLVSVIQQQRQQINDNLVKEILNRRRTQLITWRKSLVDQ